MIIGVDMDGVLVDFVGGVLPRIQQLWGIHVNYEDIPSPRIEDAINDRLVHPVSNKALCTALFQPGFFASLFPRTGAVDALRQLLRQGHELVIVTKVKLQAGHVVHEKAEWLANHLQGLEYSTIVVDSGCTKNLIDMDVLVDDDPHNLEHRSAISVCAVHPWNLTYLRSTTRKAPIHCLHTMNFLPTMIQLIEDNTDPNKVFDEADRLLSEQV